jgi:hypothetical protein
MKTLRGVGLPFVLGSLLVGCGGGSSDARGTGGSVGAGGSGDSGGSASNSPGGGGGDAAVVASGDGGTGGSSGATLNTNGVYQCPWTQATYYLRFYDDGTVISVDSTAQPVDLQAWFSKASANAAICSGIYALVGSSISFQTSCAIGASLDYVGTIASNALTLDVRNMSNGSLSTRTYTFVPLSFPQ